MEDRLKERLVRAKVNLSSCDWFGLRSLLRNMIDRERIDPLTSDLVINIYSRMMVTQEASWKTSHTSSKWTGK